MDKTPLQILKDTRELIAVPERWTKGELAKSKRGRAVKPGSSHAVCWCLSGAIARTARPRRAGWRLPADVEIAARNALRRVITGSSRPALSSLYMVEFNDTHTHSEVLAKLDEAIASLEAGE